MSSATSKTQKDVKETKAKTEEKEKAGSKLDKTKQSDIKEKLYTTRQVETSITLIDSPETDVVLEALLFVSKYADLNKNNLSCLIKAGAIEKLLNNYNRNICVLRISLRLLSVLLNSEEAVFEIDQDKYDEKIANIAQIYIEHKDSHVKEFCVEILAKIANSCRITTLIFKADLLGPIFDIIKNCKNVNMLYYTMLLFYELMDAPAAVCALPECPRYDLNTIITQYHHKEEKISNLALNIIEKLTGYGLPFLQEGFKKLALVEKMFKVLMNEEKAHQHDVAIAIINNCLNSEETSCSYVESVEFLELCQFLKSCHPKFVLALASIFVKLTNIPEIKQMLFDLSVEETIMSFFRLQSKPLINQTCEAISNMTEHKYCCQHMLTPVIANTLVDILQRQNDDEDLYNETALKTVFHFIRRHGKGLEIFLEKNFKPVLLDYFFNKSAVVSEESFQMVLEMIYKCLVHPQYQNEFLGEDILGEILKLFVESPCMEVVTICCEMMSNVTSWQIFRDFFLKNKGPQIFVDKLKNGTHLNLITQILYMILSCLIFEDVAMAFLHSGLLAALRGFNEYVSEMLPICQRVKFLALNYYLPLKFYETGRLDVTDKIPNKFYVINGTWNGAFPFLEILDMMQVSPYPTIYFVDYTYEIVKGGDLAVTSQSTIGSSSLSLSSSVNTYSGLSMPEVPSVFDINYGHISKDAFLPRYVYHLQKYEKYTEGDMENKIRLLAEYVDTLLCGPKDNLALPLKIHEYKLHLQCLKEKLGTNIIPIGFLRMGFHCERALLFKTLADKISIPCSLVKGKSMIYWNEVALFHRIDDLNRIRFYVVDLMKDVGNLWLVGSREANKYCNLN